MVLKELWVHKGLKVFLVLLDTKVLRVKKVMKGLLV